jgi:hypothetical protein
MMKSVRESAWGSRCESTVTVHGWRSRRRDVRDIMARALTERSGPGDSDMTRRAALSPCKHE